jgi:uncharacterized protein (DUF305 family)
METKALAFGIVGFLLGGLVVSVAAVQSSPSSERLATDMTMTQMTEQLKDKRGDAYDAAFITGMIEHHRGAIEMARLSADRAKHDEIKQLSRDIISAQESEIDQMRQWQTAWKYDDTSGHMMH